MLIDKLSAGDAIPELLNAVIEIAAHSDPIKYEIDKNSGAVVVDRFMNVPMHYPANYGFVPATLSEDGDPLDILVITPMPLLPGCVIACRPIGALDMADEAGRDLKLIALPQKGMHSGYDHIECAEQLAENQVAQITYFFEHYKNLESGKWVKVEGWLSREQMNQEIISSVQRYK